MEEPSQKRWALTIYGPVAGIVLVVLLKRALGRILRMRPRPAPPESSTRWAWLGVFKFGYGVQVRVWRFWVMHRQRLYDDVSGASSASAKMFADTANAAASSARRAMVTPQATDPAHASCAPLQPSASSRDT